jgi:DegT/DnrJ/EryC1/StrS aminotransferase family
MSRARPRTRHTCLYGIRCFGTSTRACVARPWRDTQVPPRICRLRGAARHHPGDRPAGEAPDARGVESAAPDGSPVLFRRTLGTGRPAPTSRVTRQRICLASVLRPDGGSGATSRLSRGAWDPGGPSLSGATHLSPAYRHLGFAPGDFPVAEALAREGLSLPLYPGISQAQLEHVCGAVADYFGSE